MKSSAISCQITNNTLTWIKINGHSMVNALTICNRCNMSDSSIFGRFVGVQYPRRRLSAIKTPKQLQDQCLSGSCGKTTRDTANAASASSKPGPIVERIERRQFLLALIPITFARPSLASVDTTTATANAVATPIFQLEAAASQAYASRDFSTAVQLLNEIVRREPGEAR